VSERDVVVQSPEQHRALAHPLRHRLLMALGAGPATVSQLARSLDVRKGSVAHHLAVLRTAGLVEPGEQRAVRGGTEQYFVRTVRRIIGPHDPGESAALVAAVASDLAAAPGDPLLHVRSLRLTAAAAARLRETLDALVSDLEEAGPRSARHTVLVTLFERS
jgi:DNA-binding transcriptional ArsR family regulator